MSDPARRAGRGAPVQFTIPVRALLVVVAVLLGVWALFSIAEALLLVFMGVFLAFVFEFPLRLFMSKTRLGRGLGRDHPRARNGRVGHGARAAAHGAPPREHPRPAARARRSSSEISASRTSSAPSATPPPPRRLRRRGEPRRHGPASTSRAGRCRRRRLRLRARGLHARVRRTLRAHRHAEDQERRDERPASVAEHVHAGRLGADHDDDLALGDRRGSDRRHRRDRAGHDGLAAGLELRARARASSPASST